MRYQRKRYTGLSAGPMDWIKNQVTGGAKNIVGGAANAAAQEANKAFSGVKAPSVGVEMSPATQKLVKRSVMGLGIAAVLTALIATRNK
jgi:hypothetical protein